MPETGVPKGFHLVDLGIFIGVLAVSLIIGLYHACTGGKQRTTNEYLMANRKMNTLPVALSMLVSFLSGIVVLGTPAEMYTRGTQLFMRTIGYCIACVISAVVIVPMFFELKVTSSFEYLEDRFKSKLTKLIGTISMLVGSVFYMGLVLYTPATALQAVTGFTLWGSILATAIIATVYTTLGGLKAVIWTDVFQATIMVLGLLLIVIKGILHVGSLEQVWKINDEGGRIEFFNINPDPTQRLSLWSTVIGGTFSTLTIFGVGQSSVQRYCSLPTLFQARMSVLLNIPFLIVMNTIASLVGLVIYAYYASVGCDPLKSKQISNSNQLVPFFIMDVLYFPGLPGAFLAVLFSGALSSMSSLLNSAAAVTWQDLIRYVAGHLSEAKKTMITKVLVVVYGLAAVGMACLAQKLGVHVLQASLSFSGATMGPSLGMFLLGGMFPFANAKGAVTGCVISSAFSLWLAIGTFVVKPHREMLPTSVERCNATDNIYGLNATRSYSSVVNNFSSRYYTDDVVWDSYLIDNSTGFHDVNETRSGNSTEWYDWINSTTYLSRPEKRPVHGIDRMYEISFLWYSTIGCVLTIVIGVFVSLLTRSKESSPTDSRLIIPIFHRIFCFIKCMHNKHKISTDPESKIMSSCQLMTNENNSNMAASPDAKLKESEMNDNHYSTSL